jgi:hypothetical protein
LQSSYLSVPFLLAQIRAGFAQLIRNTEEALLTEKIEDDI